MLKKNKWTRTVKILKFGFIYIYVYLHQAEENLIDSVYCLYGTLKIIDNMNFFDISDISIKNKEKTTTAVCRVILIEYLKSFNFL